MTRKLKVTIIGGGSGPFVVTRGLKHYPQFDLTKIVTVFDSGGSSGRLRDEFGFLPVGDLRQSLASLAQENHNSWIMDLLLYRFNKGDGLVGHNLGNLILTALQDITGSTPKALEVATKIFRLNGQVLPVTTTIADLTTYYDDGTSVTNEDELDNPKNGGKRIKKISFSKPCSLYKPSKLAIEESDYIIIGPGDLYASILPNFTVNGAKQAIKNSKAKIIYISNLMTRYTQTHNFSATDHVKVISEHIGKNPDIVVINSSKIKQDMLDHYAKQQEYPVLDDLPDSSSYQIVRKPLASTIPVVQKKSDKVKRSLLRHDQDKLTQTLLEILK